MRTRDKKARIEELSERYQDAYDEEFNDQFKNVFSGTELITFEDVQNFLDNFDFEEEYDWCWTQLDNELADAGDAAMELARDRKMGI